jgi:hypothetical protein
MGRSNIEGLGAGRSNTEGLGAGPTKAAGSTHEPLAARQRRRRAYDRLRSVISDRYWNTPDRGVGDAAEEMVWALPKNAAKWTPKISVLVCRVYPDLRGVVKQIEQLAHSPAPAPYVRASKVPLPTDPTEREAEKRRREYACVHAYRTKKRLARKAARNAAYAMDERERADHRNRDLIGL